MAGEPGSRETAPNQTLPLRPSLLRIPASFATFLSAALLSPVTRIPPFLGLRMKCSPHGQASGENQL